MCGIFGFVAKKQTSRVNVERLRAIATVTMERGPDAFGFAWIDTRGRLRMFKQRGRIVDALGLLAMARDAQMLIGHCRWATHGSPRDNLNNHPHSADGGWIVHNGVLPNYDVQVRQNKWHPVTECDSELLGLWIERREGSFLSRCIGASTLAHGRPFALAGLWNRPNRLILVRSGNPVHTGVAPEGTYFASLAPGLPDDASMMPNDSAIEFRRGKTTRAEITRAPRIDVAR